MGPVKLDQFWEFWAQWEITRGKMIVMMITIVVILILDRLWLQTSMNTLSSAVKYQAKHRIMYGIANGEGVFVSVDERPEEVVVNYAEKIINDVFTNDKDSAQKNFESVLRKYDKRAAANAKPQLQKRLNNYLSHGIHTIYYNAKTKLVEDKRQYTYISEGTLFEYAERIETDRKHIKITITLAKVPPTTVRYAGLTLLDIKEK